MTKWEEFLDRRTKNIGFLSRGNAFREPTPAEKAAALAIEIESWQASIGKKTFTTGEEYSVSKSFPNGVKKEDIPSRGIYTDMRPKAIKAYIETPMDVGGAIDITQYISRPTLLQKIMNWFRRKYKSTASHGPRYWEWLETKKDKE
jgi:hypothetical protein